MPEILEVPRVTRNVDLTGAYRQAASPAGMTADVRTLMRGAGADTGASNTLTNSNVQTQVRGPNMPEPSTITPRAPSNPINREMANAVGNISGGGNAPSPAAAALSANAGNFDPMGNVISGNGAGGVAGATPPGGTMGPVSSTWGGIKRIYNEAGGGLTGMAAGAREVIGGLATGAAMIPLGAAKISNDYREGVGSTLADVAEGFYGLPNPGAVPPVVAAAPGAVPAAGAPAAAAATIPGYGLPGADAEAMARAAPAPVVSGRNGNAPAGVVYDPVTKTYSNPATVTGGAGGPVPAGPVQNSIQVVPGGGYSGTPGFTASGGRVGSSPALSAALAAAAERGDTKALINHYGSFNGRTKESDKIDSLTEQASYLPPGSRQRAALMGEVAAIQAGQSAKASGALASRKQASEETKTRGEVGKMAAEARKASVEAASELQRQAWSDQMAALDDKTDPDRSKRYALMDAILTSQGKASEGKVIAVQEDAGVDMTGKPFQRTVGYDTRTGKKVGGQEKPRVIGPAEFRKFMEVNKITNEKDAEAELLARGVTLAKVK